MRRAPGTRVAAALEEVTPLGESRAGGLWVVEVDRVDPDAGAALAEADDALPEPEHGTSW